MPRCKYCGQEAACEVTGQQHIITCRSALGCGGTEAKFMRPLSHTKPTEAEAWADAREDGSVVD